MMASEKYLLDELAPEVREAFEEHLFGCHECAMDVRAGVVFLKHGKIALARPPEAWKAADVGERSGWWAWWRPALVIPAMAVLLLVIGYQNLVMRARNQPQLLPATTVNLLTYGENAAPLVVHAKEGFLLNVIVPPGRRYPAYKMDLYNPAGGVESVPISASGNDTWPIQIPGANLQSGTYKLTMHGLTASGEDVEVGSSSFQLQVQK